MSFYFKKAISLILIIAFIFSMCSISFAESFINANVQESKKSQTLAIDKDKIAKDRIVVKFKKDLDQEKYASKISSSISAKSFKTNNDFGYTKIKLKEGSDVLQTINTLRQDSNVEYVGPVYKTRILGDSSNDPYNNEQWGLTVTDSVYAWNKTSQEALGNIVIAVLDTGVDYTHLDLSDSILRDPHNNDALGYDYVNDDSHPYDDNGHGTHVAGIIAALKDNNIGIAGVASGAKILPVKVLDENGEGWSDDIAYGIAYAAENGADIINLSLGVDGDDPLLEAAIDYAREVYGTVVVAASGNDFGESISYPAAYSGVIAVGATDQNNNLVSFSNINSDVVAPGEDIISTVPLERDTEDGQQDGYTYYSGTSMAAPFVSGLAALILASNSELTNEDIAKIILLSSTDLGDEGRDDEFGWGIINAKRAITLPRLDLDCLYDKEDPTDIDVTLTALDYKGSVMDSVYSSVYMVLDQLTYLDSNYNYTWSTADKSVVEIAYGVYNGTISIPDVGIYSLSTSNLDEEMIDPFSELIVKHAKKPIASLSSGTYSSSQTVTLNNQTVGAAVYYTLDGTNPSLSSTEYTGPISITSSKTLKAIAVKNYTISDINTYTYIIRTTTTSGGVNGGGGNPETTITQTSSPKEIVTESDGTKTAKINPKEADLDLDSDKSQPAIIDVKTDQEVDKIEVTLTGGIFTKATQKEKIIKIESNNVNFEIAPGTIDEIDDDADVKLSVRKLSPEVLQEELKNKPKEANQAALVFDFDLTVNDKKVTEFKKPMTISVKYDSAKVKDKNKIGVYYYNEPKGSWEYVGGKVNEDGTITFTTKHFSKYTVMEYNKTFADIKTNWAKNDIEIMAAKHIANGVDDNNFLPDSQITRAEFAALVARALSLEEMSKDNVFKDVEAGKWYSESISKAFAANLINGIDSENFAPNENITREQMAVIIAKAYAYYSGRSLDSIVTTMEIRFTDEGEISDWARRNVIIANALGLINGNPDKSFNPKGNATRAQAISVIKRLMEKLEII